MLAEHILHEGRRSSIITDGNNILRRFHDTGRSVPLSVHVDGGGVLKIGGNRALYSLLQKEVSFRGAGAAGRAQRAPPAHLVRAHTALTTRRPENVVALAHALGIRVSTAWCYACQVLEHFPEDNTFAYRLVFPPLLSALLTVDQRGTLREVMQRLNDGPLRGDMEWRCIEDRYAHLRLARLCLMS